MKIVNLNYDDLRHVAQNMRKCDQEEIFATRWSDDPESLIADAMMYPQMAWIAKNCSGEPVAAGGAIPCHPKMWSVWMFATDKWPSVSFGSTKYAKKTLFPALRASGALRAECKSHHLHHVAHKWLEMLGAKRESTLQKYGKNGEDFFVFRWILNN